MKEDLLLKYKEQDFSTDETSLAFSEAHCFACGADCDAGFAMRARIATTGVVFARLANVAATVTKCAPTIAICSRFAVALPALTANLKTWITKSRPAWDGFSIKN